MGLNDYLDIQATVVPVAPAADAPKVDRSEQVNIGLEYAKRQAEKTEPAPAAIPSAGAVPPPN